MLMLRVFRRFIALHAVAAADYYADALCLIFRLPLIAAA